MIKLWNLSLRPKWTTLKIKHQTGNSSSVQTNLLGTTSSQNGIPLAERDPGLLGAGGSKKSL